ncbi:hypothetical protein SAMN04487944_12220 [Gracilibacillus ureilyticus]|uniref:Uncharacterized protein n=1 Tax=Gracilibacillus ureilyticus TaxID=531814 RepID=A0A1H9V9A5_9BACI|nr:hypothetical protein [Gracilibacillus ureilyticus]SES17994.1 hypothetical protein SAMN04487944_12220 [Gracilibacillus ureilyticus]
MLNNLLDKIYAHNIQIVLTKNKRIKIIYKKDKKIEKLKQEIKENRRNIAKRLAENQKAIDKGFHLYEHGDLYEYRYGYLSYLYIERNGDKLVLVYRLNYHKGSSKPYRTVIIGEYCSFEEGFNEAVGFLNWLEDVRK